MCAGLLILGCAACTGQDQQLQHHHEKLASLESTTTAIAEAWLTGATSAAYTRTALRQTFLLVEQERTALAPSADALSDPRGAALSQMAERLSRLLATMVRDVDKGDAASMRQTLAAFPVVLAVQR